MCSVMETSCGWELQSPDASAQCCHETLQSSELLFETNVNNFKSYIYMIDERTILRISLQTDELNFSFLP